MRSSSPLKAAGLSPPAAATNAPRAAPTFEPIRTRRAFEEICDRIRAQIAAGTLRPGDKLPPERELAEQLGVGRNALREALRSLEIAGIVRLQKGTKGGAFIQAGDASRMDEVVRDMLSLGSISVAELTEARVHIQDLVVRLACERATARRARRASPPTSTAPRRSPPPASTSSASSARASSIACSSPPRTTRC